MTSLHPPDSLARPELTQGGPQFNKVKNWILNFIAKLFYHCKEESQFYFIQETKSCGNSKKNRPFFGESVKIYHSYKGWTREWRGIMAVGRKRRCWSSCWAFWLKNASLYWGMKRKTRFHRFKIIYKNIKLEKEAKRNVKIKN